MHELSITQELINLLIEEVKKNKVEKVKKIKLVLGYLTGFSPDSIKYYFDLIKSDYSALIDAEIEFERKKGVLRCEDCNREFEADSYLTVCPFCGGLNFKTISGDEFFIEYMEAD